MVSHRIALGVTLATAALLGSCRSPLDGDAEHQLLRRSVDEAIDRELRELPSDERITTRQQPSGAARALAERREQLETFGPVPQPGETYFLPERLDLDLTDATQRSRPLRLEHAIAMAVEHNLAVQIASLQPAINEADVVAAEAAFDALLFGAARLERLDEPSQVPVLMGIPLGTPFNASERYLFETGLRKRLVTGGLVQVSTDVLKTNNKTPGFNLSPDPAWSTNIRLSLEQPLLRGFGSPVTTASIRLARNAERDAIEALRTELLDVVADTEVAYWDLALAWHELAVRQWLVQVGVDVRDKLERRLELDTTLAEFSDAVARVEARTADVIRARRSVRAASDRLKLLQNDPTVTVASELVYVPVDEPIAAAISYSGRDAIMTAVRRRPELQQAILAIDDATIRETLADDLRLPLLNLDAEVAYLGLQDDLGEAYDEANDGTFVDYIVGLVLEIPIGNREAESQFRRARLQRSAAVIGYRRTVQSIVLDVKSALRDVVTNYELLSATGSSRLAAAENLRALLAQEETLASLTPEFLNLKLNRQESLANARFQEMQALVAFDQSVARLYRAMGIGLEMNRIDLEIAPPDDAVGRGPADATHR